VRPVSIIAGALVRGAWVSGQGGVRPAGKS